MISFMKRNMLLYFRDRTAVFFSLLSVLILVLLYVLFLGELTGEALPDFPSKQAMLLSYIVAGVLTVTSLTTTMGALGNLVVDRSKRVDRDFLASPIPRSTLVGGYIASSLVVGLIMCLLTFAFSYGYLWFSGDLPLAVTSVLQLIGVIVLSVLASGSMALFLVSFFHTSNAFAAASMVIGTLIGFVAGIYIPIGSLPDYLQAVVKYFPISHATALFRQVLMETPIHEAFAGAPAEMKEQFLTTLGVRYELGGKAVSPMFSIVYLLITTAVFYMLSLLVMKKKQS